MRIGRILRGLGWSLTAHAILVGTLWVRGRGQANRQPNRHSLIELEIVATTTDSIAHKEVRTQSPEILPRDQPAQNDLHTPSTTVLRKLEPGSKSPDRDTFAANQTAGRGDISTPSANVDDKTISHAGSIEDRLWTFRASPLRPSPPSNSSGEEPQLLVRRPRVDQKTRTVDGQGGVKMILAEDGSVELFNNPPPVTLEGLGGRFGLDDVLLSALGQNPYRYEKHRLAESTRDERIGRMIEWQRKTELNAIFVLNDQLGSILADPDLSNVGQRRLIFMLWDECSEDAGERNDKKTHKGTIARAAIEAFVRKHFPEGSTLAYPKMELAMLNGLRTSGRAFDPYGIETDRSLP